MKELKIKPSFKIRYHLSSSNPKILNSKLCIIELTIRVEVKILLNSKIQLNSSAVKNKPKKATNGKIIKYNIIDLKFKKFRDWAQNRYMIIIAFAIIYNKTLLKKVLLEYNADILWIFSYLKIYKNKQSNGRNIRR